MRYFLLTFLTVVNLAFYNPTPRPIPPTPDPFAGYTAAETFGSEYQD